MIFTEVNPPIPGHYINPVKQPGDFLIAYEMGSLALNNPAGGLMQQLWTLTSDGFRIWISAPNTPRQLLITDALITEIDLAFDQNMQPFVTYVSLGIVKYYWYDALAGHFVTTELLEIAVSPRCTLDDKRPFDVANSDIILMYIDALFGVLMYRAQRERYATAHALETVGPNERLQCVNFADTNRLQWTINDVTPYVQINSHKGLANYSRPVSITGAYIS